MKKIALLWPESSLGLYSNRSVEELCEGFGHNTGNLAFFYAIRHHIVGEIHSIPWHSPADMVAPYDVVIIPCANQLGPHTHLGHLAILMQRWQVPIVAIGLGAQAPSMNEDVEVSEGTLEWVRTIAAKSSGVSNIWTRGPYTTKQLARLGINNATTGNCPSHFINTAPDLGKRIAAAWGAFSLPRSISLAGGHQTWPRVRTSEQQLIALLNDPLYRGQYVVQSSADMIRIARGDFADIEAKTLDRIRLHLTPHYTLDEFKAWCRLFARVYFDVPAWMESLRQYDLTIGPRYHGVALALQAERMGVTITIDSRTEEMCLQTGVPFIPAEKAAQMPLTRTTIKEMIQFDPSHYDALRAERAAAYVSFLEANGLQPADFLKRIAAP